MKKLSLVTLALLMVLGLSSCGSEQNEGSALEEANESVETEANENAAVEAPAVEK